MGRKKRQPQEFTEEKKEYLKQYKKNNSFSKTTTNNNEKNNGCISKRKLVDYNDNEVQYDNDFEMHTASDSFIPVQGNSVMDMDLLKYAIQATAVCSKCHSSLQLKEAVDKRHGWAQTLVLACLNNECESEPYFFETSKKQKDKRYDINSQCVLGFSLSGFNFLEYFVIVQVMEQKLYYK